MRKGLKREWNSEKRESKWEWENWERNVIMWEQESKKIKKNWRE